MQHAIRHRRYELKPNKAANAFFQESAASQISKKSPVMSAEIALLTSAALFSRIGHADNRITAIAMFRSFRFCSQFSLLERVEEPRI